MSESNLPPRPIISVAIIPRNNSDHEKLQRALRIIAQEDPAIQIKTEFVGSQTILSGMTDLHLEATCDRISHEFKISLDIGEPRVIYLETIRRRAEGEGKYIRQTGGSGNYAHCNLRIRAQPAGQRLRVHQRHQGPSDSHPIHHTHRRRRATSARKRHLGGSSDGRRQGNSIRRQLSGGGIKRNGLQDSRLHGLEGSRTQGEASTTRANNERRDHSP